MRRVMLSLLIAAAASAILCAAVGFEQLTVPTATAVGFTSTVIRPTTGDTMQSVTCSVGSAPIRYRTDGGAPTATVGTWIATSATVTIARGDLVRNFRAISATAAGSSVLDCNFWSN